MNLPPQHRCSGYARAWPLLLVTVLCLGFPGCASLDATPEPGPRTIEADWNDVHPAVLTAAKKVEMAIVKQEQAAGGLTIYHLRTVTDEPAMLYIRATNPDYSGLQPLQLSAKVGRFGDRRWEAQLMTAVQERLNQLAGVDHAPLN